MNQPTALRHLCLASLSVSDGRNSSAEQPSNDTSWTPAQVVCTVLALYGWQAADDARMTMGRSDATQDGAIPRKLRCAHCDRNFVVSMDNCVLDGEYSDSVGGEKLSCNVLRQHLWWCPWTTHHKARAVQTSEPESEILTANSEGDGAAGWRKCLDAALSVSSLVGVDFGGSVLRR